MNNKFMIFAKIHSLNPNGSGLEDALDRARAYLDHGVDGIMLPRLDPTSTDVTSFFSRYAQITRGAPIIASPHPTIPVSEKELRDLGVKMVIYEDRVLQTANSSIERIARHILTNKGA